MGSCASKLDNHFIPNISEQCSTHDQSYIDEQTQIQLYNDRYQYHLNKELSLQQEREKQHRQAEKRRLAENRHREIKRQERERRHQEIQAHKWDEYKNPESIVLNPGESLVQIHIYDISHGMTKKFSPFFLKHQVDGMWHSGLVAFGYEYFFGKGGVRVCTHEKFETESNMKSSHLLTLGKTSKTNGEFIEWLKGVEMSKEWHGSKYHIFDRNCNEFSNIASMFLTNRNIPKDIIDLPKAVDSTPLGKMIRDQAESSSDKPNVFLSLATELGSSSTKYDSSKTTGLDISQVGVSIYDH